MQFVVFALLFSQMTYDPGCVLPSEMIIRPPDRNSRISLVFYNVENLFDPSDDPESQDDEFTPEGDRRWTHNRYQKKINHLYKTIIASGHWDPPDVIGFCEVENKKVLTDLFRETPLSKYSYHIIHYDSGDERGIDVALAARRDVFKVWQHGVLKPTHSSFRLNPTRDVLYAQGGVGGDTLHIFINRWPSRRSGTAETAPLRMEMARLVRTAIDSLLTRDPFSRIILMGDFNDEPDDPSIGRILGVSSLEDTGPQAPDLLCWELRDQPVPGTYKYQGRWYHFDHFFASGALFADSAIIRVDPVSFRVMTPDFLLIEDALYLGKKPFPTYHGFKYEGGFSDHLPIRLELVFH